MASGSTSARLAVKSDSPLTAVNLPLPSLPTVPERTVSLSRSARRFARPSSTSPAMVPRAGQLLARRRRHGVPEIDREHLEEPWRDDAGVAETVGVGHRPRVDEPQREPGRELRLGHVREVARRRRDEPHVLVDQLRPLGLVGAQADRADVPEPDRGPAAIHDPVGIDVHVPPDGRERPGDEAPELVRLLHGEEGQGAVGDGLGALDQSHASPHTVTALASLAKPPSE